ncbi:MAG: membrane protein insertion efficiency factor YidD [Clostridia bacterium]|nr:membrane protein insertion efficiency factor YidD [Clostridia bacterium]MBQ8792080.1 membrane protein insertion efficiency factor YidD [Clostridia bacterium]
MKWIKKTFTFILKLPVYIYKGCISPLLPHTCRFYPTCSSYMLEAINTFGIRGIKLGIKRILKCRPKSKYCGYDPLPINIKGEAKWLI